MTAGEAALPGGPPAPPRRPTARAHPEPSREPRRELTVPGGGVRRFISEALGELKKVEWPGQNQLIQGVAVVLVACLIVGLFLYGCDLVFKRVVEHLFVK
jgi:preprotein translocase SecE subunit